MATRTFVVEDIHCAGCEMAIRRALTRVEGVREVRPDAATNQVSVAFDEARTSDQEIGERLAAAGYPVVS
ncbi:heavy-metal-associated domain-containing protein [Pseudonocardia nigra]|uniref:heavy-metal-associated domain-containing protein n=1 Tax=Pseudonocardia nigra TaxID=1921578 RepID=UPI001C5D1390|nr:heavy-metal-associated domain-containing protein [Pseudonocardia nigra]